MATAEFSKFAGILNAVLSQHHFRIWNISTGIPLPPLALFSVMLPKALLTSHSRMYPLLGQCIFVLIESWNLKTPTVVSFSLKLISATLSHVNDDSSLLHDDGNGRVCLETQFVNVSVSTLRQCKKFYIQWTPYIPMYCTSSSCSMIICLFLKEKKNENSEYTIQLDPYKIGKIG